jgi:nucleotide-binding universal stress UspA family protein
MLLDEEDGLFATVSHTPSPPLWLGTVFDRIVCGVDGTDGSLVAVRQAARLLPARRILELVAVAEDMSGWPSPAADEERSRRSADAREILAEARRIHRSPHSCVRFGTPAATLAAAARDALATLIVVGAPRRSGRGGFIPGSVSSYLLHNAHSSVLIARPCVPADAFPRSIVVGHDGSRSAAGAAHVGRELAHRFDASIRVVSATGHTPVAVDRLAAEEQIEWSPLRPVDALTAASKEADLLIVGSRGLGGSSSLGSVSERVGQLARCSVLVLREPLEAGAVADAVPDLEC